VKRTVKINVTDNECEEKCEKEFKWICEDKCERNVKGNVK